ncbi:S1C family serine protease [Cellulomonas alba]|uniref:Trypsin-like peptidase domain-containing protein n=1 Tax=Cellulomonas alba TaxID=3053467 RepID=A0ABT7SE46_9CELL|nr:trypsin-like peptidase domain-containing protein [Cellulomonas alba]MDM7854401.1 trypsin-like peptidase domain-containing protein [Cellulomonas alba]
MTSTPDQGQGPADEQAAPVPPRPADETQPLPATDDAPQLPLEHTQPIAAPQYGAGTPVPPPPAQATPAPQASAATPPFVPPAQQSQPYPQHTAQAPFGYGAPQHGHPAQPGYPASQPGQPAPQPGQPTPVAYAPTAAGDGQVADAGAAPAPRKRRVWVPVASAAAVAAIVGALAAGGITHALDDGHGSTSAFGNPASMATLGGSNNGAVPVSGSTNEDPNWEAVANAVKASVVAITVTTSQGTAQGSGVIVDDKGHVVTNNHVVNGAQGDVEVTLTDGRLLKGKVVGTDATTDLAVVELENAPSNLQAAEFGDSSKVTVGQPVMAVGNPLGLANTVTTGIVSAVNRPVTTTAEDGSGSSTVTNAIQIDAAINPGNSGGPLFDAQGRIIGINSSIATTSSASGSIGLGFAIPVNLVQNIAQQLVASGSAKHAFLGVSLTDGTATADGVTRRGALVHDVTAGSPAAKAGVKANDVIVAIDGNPTAGADSLTAFVRSYPADAKAKLTIVRDGKTSDVDVTLAVRQETPSQGGNGNGQQGPGDGNGQQGQGNGNGQQGQGDGSGQGNGQPGDGSGQGGLNGMTPDQLWQWFQQQQQQRQGGSGTGQG